MILYNGIISGLLTVFIVIILKKWGVIEYLQTKSNTFFYQLLSCNFCLSFYISVILFVLLFTYDWSHDLVMVPFLSTVIAWRIL
jgi:hypothetical protein